jgi:uncharacterized protein YbjT (DUF2867 family)
MKVFLTGATGFVGQAILQKCVDQGHHVYCFIRSSSGHKLSSFWHNHPQVYQVEGDLENVTTYEKALENCDAVIHLVGIIRENPRKQATFQKVHIDVTRSIVNASVKAGVKRFVHMSALGARPNATSSYHASKWEGEEVVRNSDIPYVIFRPSVIFGPDDEFVNMLAGLVKLPIAPVIGDGKYRLQPVSIHTVSELFEQALTTAHVNSEYEVGGPGPLSYNEILDLIGQAIGKQKVHKLHQPLWIMKPMIYALDRFSFFPITRNQLTMLLEENICANGGRIYSDFEVKPVRFEDGISEYLK